MEWKRLFQITKHKNISSKAKIKSLNSTKTKVVCKSSCQTKSNVIPIILNHLLHASGITAVIEEMDNQYQIWLFITTKRQHNNDVPSVLLLGIRFLQTLAPENEHLQREQTHQLQPTHITADQHQGTALEITSNVSQRFPFQIGQIS